MILGQVAPIGEDVHLIMAGGRTFTGHFQSMTEPPYLSFAWMADSAGNYVTIYINQDQIIAVCQIGDMLGSSNYPETNGKTDSILGSSPKHAGTEA